MIESYYRNYIQKKDAMRPGRKVAFWRPAERPRGLGRSPIQRKSPRDHIAKKRRDAPLSLLWSLPGMIRRPTDYESVALTN